MCMIVDHALGNLTYSDSVVDIATTLCRLPAQVSRAAAKQRTKPVVESSIFLVARMVCVYVRFKFCIALVTCVVSR